MGLGIRQLPSGTGCNQRGEQIGLGAVAGGNVFQNQFHRLPNIFPQHAGKVGLPLAGFFDGIEQAGYTGRDILDGFRAKQLPQAVEFLGAIAAIEPTVAFPFRRRLEIQARIDQPELAAVGEQAQAMARHPQQFQEPGIGGSASTSPNVRRSIGHHQQGDLGAGFVGKDNPMGPQCFGAAADSHGSRRC